MNIYFVVSSLAGKFSFLSFHFSYFFFFLFSRGKDKSYQYFQETR